LSINGNAVNISVATNSSSGASNATNQSTSSPSPVQTEARGLISSSHGGQIYVPMNLLSRVYEHFPGAEPVRAKNNPGNNLWQFPCNSSANIDIRINIGGDEYAIDSRDVAGGEQDDHMSGGILGIIAPTPASGMCLAPFMG
jgi:hypothetical protein